MAARTEPLLPFVKRVAQTRVYRSLLARLSPDLLAGIGKDPIAVKEIANIGVPAEIVAYFADKPANTYQMESWLPVFEQLHLRHSMLLVTRNLGTFRYLRDRTRLPLVYARHLPDVEDLLGQTDPKVCLYVNNTSSNFQILGWRRSLHVHLNHGESDKISMASNQAKAYDVVLVAGEAAEARYKEGLLDFDGSSLVRIGRPQLDFEVPRQLRASKRPTVLYAPTWDGETAAMNYTSIPRYGPRLVRALVADGGFRVVYKPHPRVATGSRRTIAAHDAIVKALRAANAQLPEPERHVVELEAPIVAFFASCDAMLSDVSSVALDWLYLRTAAPLWIVDPREDRQALERASPLAARTYVLDSHTIGEVVARIRESIDEDPRRAERETARRYYFGDLAPGESTRRFLDAIGEVVARRDVLLVPEEAALSGGPVPAGESSPTGVSAAGR